MKVLVLGSGGREHAIAWKISRSRQISGLYVAPGNAGTAALGENLETVNPESPDQVIAACKEKQIDYVFIGPEAPLAAGMVDALRAEHIPCFGPHRQAAQLESSKVFSKEFMLRHRIPTAAAHTFHSFKDFKAFIKSSPGKWVLKKSGLAAGKGVFESDNPNALLAFGKEVLKSDALVAEAFLTGYEISLFALTDSRHFILLPACADFKKAEAGDAGPNTGGMGAICPVPIVGKEMMQTIRTQIAEPTFRGMAEEGLSYKGLLYFGLMITESGPQLLEYNVRFGDPETQALVPLLHCDFIDLFDAIEEEKLDQFEIPLLSQFALGVVVAAPGYPGKYKKGIEVQTLPESVEKECLLFHASTHTDEAGKVRTGGGRCFTVVGIGDDLISARHIAYRGAGELHFEGGWTRPDIGNKFMDEKLCSGK